MLVQSFISCHLDYCNSLFSGITASSRHRARRCDHITPVLRQLHWLPVRQQVEFKLALLVYKALRDSTSVYLVDDRQLVSHAATIGRHQRCVPRICYDGRWR